MKWSLHTHVSTMLQYNDAKSYKLQYEILPLLELETYNMQYNIPYSYQS